MNIFMKVFKKLVIGILVLTLSVTGVPMGNNSRMEPTKTVKAETGSNIRYPHFLKASGTVLKDNYGTGNTVYLRGVNAGGYMLQELWMCPTTQSSNVKDQLSIVNKLTERFGKEKARELIQIYEKNYWTEADFVHCKELGFNCIRLPIWYRNLVDENDNWHADAFERIDWFVEQAGKYGMYVIIDMHGAYGSQNGSDHSGVDGGDDKITASQFFFGDNAAANQEKYYKMWEKIAKHYKGNPVVAGYDLLNEPYSSYRYDYDKTGKTETELCEMLWDIYDTAYKKIRAIDADHVIIMEEVWEPDDLPNPNGGANTNRNSSKIYTWSNVMYEDHNYLYRSYNNENGDQISNMQRRIENIKGHSSYNVPYLMGEFNYMSKNETWDDGVKLLNDNGLNWTVWSYKCISSQGNWGLYHQDVEKVNIETDDYDTIKSKWSNVGTGTENTGITQYIKKYTPGTVNNLTEAENIDISTLNLSAVGGAGDMEVTVTPMENMPEDTQYYVYLDGGSEPVQIVSPKIEAENWSDQNGVAWDKNSTDDDGAPLQNVGGTHNGEWTKYQGIDFGNGTAIEFTARYAAEYNSVGGNPKLEIYVDSMDSANLVGTLNLEKKTGETWHSYKLGTAVLDKTITGPHDIYIKYVVDNNQNVCNLDWFRFSAQNVNPLTLNFEDLTAGTHSVSVKTYVNGNFSEAKTVNVEVLGALTSEAVGIQGFQVKTNNKLSYGSQEYDISGVAYRTICTAPKKDSTIAVNGKQYTVTNVGTIYAADPKNELQETDTYLDLDAGLKQKTDSLNTDKYYEYYQGKNQPTLTYGYIATEEGMLKNADETSDYINYVRSLAFLKADTDYEKYLQMTMHVRAFVEAVDSNGKKVIIYGKDTQDISVAEIADYIYRNSLASNYQGHKYLYNEILNIIDTSNPYYRNTTVDYGWNDNLYTPEQPTATYPTIIDKGDPEVKTDASLNDMWQGIAFTDAQGNTDETPDKLFDGDTGTKFCAKKDATPPFTIGWKMKRAVTVKSYTLVTGDDTSKNPNRNPHSWKLLGSVDGVTWEVLDTVEDGGIEAKDKTEYTYSTDVRKACLYFKLEIIDSGTAGNYGQFGNLQLSEIYLKGDVVPATSQLGVDLKSLIAGVDTTTTTVVGNDANNEGLNNLFDNDQSTKLYSKTEAPCTIGWTMSQEVTVYSYTLKTANDHDKSPNRTLKSWVLYGSQDGENWDVIDTVKDSGMKDVNYKDYTYAVDKVGTYTRFKLEVTEKAGTGFQLSEIGLKGCVDLSSAS